MKYATVLSVIALPVFAAPAFAACSVAASYDAGIVEIVESLRAAPNEAVVQALSAAMWEIWLAERALLDSTDI